MDLMLALSFIRLGIKTKYLDIFAIKGAFDVSLLLSYHFLQTCCPILEYCLGTLIECSFLRKSIRFCG